MRFSTFATLLSVAVVTMAPAGADEKEKENGWSTTAELGLVATGGNSESETFALSGVMTKKMGKSSITLKVGGPLRIAYSKVTLMERLVKAVLSPFTNMAVTSADLGSGYFHGSEKAIRPSAGCCRA